MNGTLLLIYFIGILINIFYIKYKNNLNKFKFDTTILLMYMLDRNVIHIYYYKKIENIKNGR